jgi:large subunit ribosomal protein L17
MRHRIAGYQLGRDRDHRRALRRNLARSLFLHGKILTTHAKAKAVRPFAEKLITLGKRGDLAARRRALVLLPDKDVVKKLFDEVAPKFQDRAGGYTRVLKTTDAKNRINRLGDNAKVAILELVGQTEEEAKAAKKAKKRKRGKKEAKEEAKK